MIGLNLNEPSVKKRLVKEKIVLLVRDIIMLSLFVLFVNTTFIYISQKTLQNNFNQITSQKESITTYNKPFNTEVKETNKKISLIDKVQSEYRKWSVDLVTISAAVPPGITTYNINFNLEQKKLVISGNAATRDNFLKFKDNLEQLEIINNIESPLSNILQQDDINFSLKCDLDI